MRREYMFEGKKLITDIIHSEEGFLNFLNSLQLKGPFIVKPNWICKDRCHYTDPQILEWVLKAFHERGEVVLVESYSARNMMVLHDLKPKLTLTDIERERVRETEEDFLTETGTKDVIDDLGIEYVNVTEEVFEGRIVEEEVVRGLVEELFPPVLRDELYSFLPEKLYALRGGTLVNLAKLKLFFTLCTKNMFGLIPEYVGYGSRFVRYHGKADKDLAQNIVDVNKIYRSIFNVVGIGEGVNCLSHNICAGKARHRSVFGYRYDILENKGLTYYCEDPLWLDTFVYRQCGRNPLLEEHLRLGYKTFGGWPQELIKEARGMRNPLE